MQGNVLLAEIQLHNGDVEAFVGGRDLVNLQKKGELEASFSYVNREAPNIRIAPHWQLASKGLHAKLPIT